VQARHKIAVAGATGRLGRHVVDVLEARGHDVVPMSRATGVDVITTHGLAEALVGADCIVDAATGPSPDQEQATSFFTTAARNLQAAGSRAGVGRLVMVSIIGCDRFSAGYGLAKLVHERKSRSGPIPAAILRAAQFHEFVAQLVDWGRQGDVGYVQAMRTQLVAARTVAEALADLATQPDLSASDATFEIAGPRVEQLVDVARMLVAHRGESLRIEGVRNVADPDLDVYESGALLPGPGATLAGPTFEAWLHATPVAVGAGAR